MNRRLSTALLSISASLALPLLSASPASAVTVTVDSIDYEVDVFTASYSGNESVFQSPPPGKMPWWGDSTGDLASAFAAQVYDQLGAGPTADYGPVFAYELSANEILGIAQNLSDPLNQLDVTIPVGESVKYAIAKPLRPTPSSVPVPLPVFGAAAAFGWSRQIRKRIVGSQQQSGASWHVSL